MNIQIISTGNIFKNINTQIGAILIDAGIAKSAIRPSIAGEPTYTDVLESVLRNFTTRPAARTAYGVVAYDLKPSTSFLKKKSSDGGSLFENWVRSALKRLGPAK